MDFIKVAVFLSCLTLTVLAQKPVLSMEPRSAAVKTDETVSFRCRVVSGSQPVQLEWKRSNNQPLADNVKIGPDGSVLTIVSARPANQGQYRCIATNTQGKASIAAVLTIKQLPKVRITPSSPVRVSAGGTVSLECQVSGRPRPSISWIKQEASRETVLRSTTTETSVALQLTVSAPEDAGTFVCRAQTREGSAEGQVEVRMEGRAVYTQPAATVSPTALTAVEGQTVTMYCQATGFPAPEISWSKLRAPLPWQHRVEGGTLILTNVGRQDSGQYICNATNALGFSEAYADMEVDTPPYVTSIPDKVSARRGDALRLQCIAHGSHPISYRWTRVGGATMPAGAKTTKEGLLLIGHLKVADSGTYKCVATNHVGSGETLASVTVRASKSDVSKCEITKQSSVHMS